MTKPLAIVEMFAALPDDLTAHEYLTMLTVHVFPGSTAIEINKHSNRVTANHLHYTLNQLRKKGYVQRRVSMTTMIGRPHYKWSLTDKGINLVTKLNFYLQPNPPITN